MDELLVTGEFYSVRAYEFMERGGAIEFQCYTCANYAHDVMLIDEDEDSIEMLHKAWCETCKKPQSIVAHDGNRMHQHDWHTERDEVNG